MRDEIKEGEKSIDIYMEYEGVDFRFYPPITDGQIKFDADSFGLDDLEFDINKVYMGLECQNMTNEEVKNAYRELQKSVGGEICKARLTEGEEIKIED